MTVCAPSSAVFIKNHMNGASVRLTSVLCLNGMCRWMSVRTTPGLAAFTVTFVSTQHTGQQQRTCVFPNNGIALMGLPYRAARVQAAVPISTRSCIQSTHSCLIPKTNVPIPSPLPHNYTVSRKKCHPP